jgi:alanine-glyoxylate transaminase / serine-glyoxylate transaminase / serine-pyruvate transaminase
MVLSANNSEIVLDGKRGSSTVMREQTSVHDSSIAPLKPPTRYLFGPGPTMVDPRVYQALAKPIVGHLDPYFIQVMQDVQDLVKRVYGAANGSTLVISGTGSAGMEAAVTNFVEPGAKFAVFANGYFSDRLTEMAKRNGANVVRFEKAWGEVFSDTEVAEFIRREKPTVVGYVHAETSTGALQRGEAICAAAHDAGALVIADCVTSLGGLPVEFDKTGIDISYSCSQKGLSCPPGLSPLALSKRAMDWLSARTSPSRSWYLIIRRFRTAITTPRRFPCFMRCGRR